MKNLSIKITLLIALSIGTSFAEEKKVPGFFKNTLPESALPGILGGWGSMKSESAPLDAKTTELIALAVAAQIPCKYCIHAHSTAARKLGATDAEVKHAIGVAGYVRLFSTSLHGTQYNFEEFTSEYDKMLNSSE